MQYGRIINLFVASLLLHCGLYLVLTRLSEDYLTTNSTDQKYIRLKLTERTEKDSSSEFLRRGASEVAAKFKSTADENPKHTNQSTRGYQKLLPGPGTFLVSDNSADEDISKSRRVISFDAGQHIPLKSIAEELSARIDVPKTVFELRKSGSAVAKISRSQSGLWHARIQGIDAYSRAVLERAFSSIPSNSVGLENLKKIKYDYVELSFNFSTLPTTVLDKKPRLLKIVGNRIMLDVYHYEDPPSVKLAAQAIAAVNPTTLGINILGLGKVALDSLATKAAPRQSLDVITLRQSPAFTKEIFSIPLK